MSLMIAQPDVADHSTRSVDGRVRCAIVGSVTDWIVDLDGVMWRGEQPISGSRDAVRSLLDRGDRVLFCTNNSTMAADERLVRTIGPAGAAGASMVTSADAVCLLVKADERVLVLGSPGLSGVLSEAGVGVTSTTELARELHRGALWSDPGAVRSAVEGFDAVVVGFAGDCDYEQLDLASSAVRHGARLLATNTDPTFPAAGRIRPGTGAIVAALETATGHRAEVAGKPHPPMAEIILGRLDRRGHGGPGPGSITTAHAGESRATAAQAAPMIVVGDRMDTDGALAAQLGCDFALVLSGVTTKAPVAGSLPGGSAVPGTGVEGLEAVASDLAALVEGRLIAGSLPHGVL